MPSRQPPDPVAPTQIPAATVLPDHRRNHHLIMAPLMLVLAVAAVISLAAAAALAVLLYRRLCRGRAAPSAPVDLKPPSSPLRQFTYAQLRRATASFAPSNRLGQGGFGPVYRGALASGQEIAVKLMDSGSLQGEREFQNELVLAGKMAAMGSPTDRAWVVGPLGFCCSDTRQRRWWRRKGAAEADEAVEGCAARPGRRFLLVYELMHNGSLQDALLDRRCPELLDWGRRYSVAVDIARGLQFLHAVCDPPVIHGDIKPSNILLDSRLSARIADFGLARLKTSVLEDALTAGSQLDEEETVVEIDLDKAVPSDAKSGKNHKDPVAASPEISSRNNGGGGGGGEDDASIMGETAESTTTTGYEEVTGCFHSTNHEGNGIAAIEKSPEEDESTPRVPEASRMTLSPVDTGLALEVASTSEAGGFDRMSVDSGTASSSRRGGRKKGMLSGKDWWWRQDVGAGGNPEPAGSVKDYVMEWIRSEIKKERPKSDWITAPAVSTDDCLPRPSARPDRKKQQRRLEWWASLDEEKLKKKEKSRPSREWWREEFCEELTNKQKRRMNATSRGEQKWWQNDEDFSSAPESRKKRKKKKSVSHGSRNSIDLSTDGISGDMRMTGRRSSRDWASGEVPRSGTMSSTPSMRGTVCYVAPEYGGGGPLSERCDIYSLGVLLLVLISGRRPLQVTASPMSEFERANLISWARNLAHLGRLLDLVDPSLQSVDRDQALHCITIALLCIQRSPARRPSIKEVVGMLTGQSEPPHLPLEFSPSPPGGFSFKSRKKAL